MLSPPIPGCPGSNLANKKGARFAPYPSAGRFQHLLGIRKYPEAERRREEERTTPTSRRRRIGRGGKGGSEASSEERPIGEGGKTPSLRRAVDEARIRETTEGMRKDVKRNPRRHAHENLRGGRGRRRENTKAVRCSRFAESAISQKNV